VLNEELCILASCLLRPMSRNSVLEFSAWRFLCNSRVSCLYVRVIGPTQSLGFLECIDVHSDGFADRDGELSRNFSI